MDIGWLVGPSDPILSQAIDPCAENVAGQKGRDRLANINLDNDWGRLFGSQSVGRIQLQGQNRGRLKCSADRRMNELQMSVVIHWRRERRSPLHLRRPYLSTQAQERAVERKNESVHVGIARLKPCVAALSIPPGSAG